MPISENTLDKVTPDFNRSVIKELRIFVVEKLKTARQFLRKIDATFPIDDTIFFEQDKHNDYNFHPDVIKLLHGGKDIGLLSESGYPGVADPGSKIVALAHDNGCSVIPLVGASSLLMAIAASGLNGQGFTFHGYLPVDASERSKKIKGISADISKTGYAHLFIETPYRNKQLFDDLLIHADGSVRLTIACDVTGEHEQVITKTISAWRLKPFVFEKLPVVFIIGK